MAINAGLTTCPIRGAGDTRMKFSLFQRWALATLLATLFLVFVGGFVRAAGAGLGCPDWPKCWGLWLPPVSIEEIDPTVYDVSQFNRVKMWIEYANRLIGVAIGLLVVGTFLLSFTQRRTRPSLIGWSFLAVLLVVFQGWLGGRVVRSGLEGGAITIHLAAALVLLTLLLWIVYRAAPFLAEARMREAFRGRLVGWTVGLLVVTAIQILLGARVRELADAAGLAKAESLEPGWIAELGGIFLVHRSFAWALVAAAAGLWWIRRQAALGGFAGSAVTWIVVLVAVQVGSGIGLQHFGMPPAFQVIHLGGSTIVYCLGVFLLLALLRRDPSPSPRGLGPLPASREAAR